MHFSQNGKSGLE